MDHKSPLSKVLNMKKSQKIEEKAKLLWGKNLHHETKGPVHCNQLKEVFKDRWDKSLYGKLLEIGCGNGSDLEVFLNNKNISHITAIDLGENIHKLSEIYKDNDDIVVEHGNALSLSFEKNEFDIIYSFGVFHHTSDPIKCISEAHRVLKNKGSLFLYLYSSHEDLILKKIGISIESTIMKIFQFIPFSLQSIVCNILSPFCWIIFSAPSLILKIMGFKTLAKKFPFYFGLHPFSLVSDLKDRLMSPINHRFSKSETEKILIPFNFYFSEVVKTSSGLYIFAQK